MRHRTSENQRPERWWRTVAVAVGIGLSTVAGCGDSGDQSDSTESVTVQLVGADEDVRGNIKLSRVLEPGVESDDAPRFAKIDKNTARLTDVDAGLWQVDGVFAAAQDPLCGWDAEFVLVELDGLGETTVALPVNGFCS